MKEKKKYQKPVVNKVKLELQIGPLGVCSGQGSNADETFGCQSSFCAPD